MLLTTCLAHRRHSVRIHRALGGPKTHTMLGGCECDPELKGPRSFIEWSAKSLCVGSTPTHASNPFLQLLARLAVRHDF
jgi:hypothetical protein